MDTAVVVSLAGGFQAVVEVRGHRVVLDEPASVGGDDAGPSPIEAVLGALGACTAMTLRMYAARKGWPLDAVRVRVTQARLSRAECLDCPADGEFPLVDRIHRSIEVEGALDDGQLARLLEMADRCPVHRLLAKHPTVVTELVRAPGA